MTEKMVFICYHFWFCFVFNFPSWDKLSPHPLNEVVAGVHEFASVSLMTVNTDKPTELFNLSKALSRLTLTLIYLKFYCF